jgi:hypothetical protein
MTQAIRDELRTPKRHWSDNPAILLARVSLGVIYMYLILVSYELLGISGPVFISVLFLVSFFVPQAYRLLTQRLQKKAKLRKQATVAEEARQEA